MIAITAAITLASCRADIEETDEQAHRHNLASEASAETVVHETDAVVGPDHAFFVYSFMREIASYQGPLGLDRDVNLEKMTKLDLHGEAFAFDSNFKDERIEIAADWMVFSADTDHDGVLSLAELSKLKLQAKDLGSYGDDLSLPIKSSQWQLLVGSSDGLTKTDLKDLIVRLGLLIDSAPERKSLVKEWLAYVSKYDLDADGITDYEEQQKLREDRKRQLELISRNAKSS